MYLSNYNLSLQIGVKWDHDQIPITSQRDGWLLLQIIKAAAPTKVLLFCGEDVIMGSENTLIKLFKLPIFFRFDYVIRIEEDMEFFFPDFLKVVLK